MIKDPTNSVRQKRSLYLSQRDGLTDRQTEGTTYAAYFIHCLFPPLSGYQKLHLRPFTFRLFHKCTNLLLCKIVPIVSMVFLFIAPYWVTISADWCARCTTHRHIYTRQVFVFDSVLFNSCIAIAHKNSHGSMQRLFVVVPD